MHPQARIMDRKLLSKYEQNMQDRRQFRNQMRAELKALAKKSFVEEFEMWRTAQKGTGSVGRDESKTVQQLQQEIDQLHQIVDNLNHGQSMGASSSSPFPWSSPIAANQRSRGPETRSSPRLDDQEGNQSNFFVLSTAPITNFDTIIHQQMSSRGPSVEPPAGSLLEQAKRFAEISSLFTMPSLDDDEIFDKQFQRYNAEQEAERARQKEMQKLHKKKLESSVENHRDRLEKARHPPRRFPLENKPSSAFTSPRAKIHRFTLSQPADSEVASPTSMNATAMQANSLFELSETSIDIGEAGMTLNNNTSDAAATAAAVSSPASPATSPKKAELPPTMLEDDFLKKTGTLEEQIKRLVKEVVHNEIVNDCKTHHYTQRAQKKVVAKHENLLVQKIEKSLGDRVKSVQEELQKLKDTKLLKLQNDAEQWVASQDVAAILGQDATPEQIQGLTAEVKSVVNQALRFHFNRSHGGDGDFDEEGGSNIHSRVHGSINTRASFGTKSGMGDFDKDSPAPAPMLASLVEEVMVKPKSKAERMLGITTDTKSGLPVNDVPAASTKQGSGFFGIGSLFSSKPGSSGGPAMTDFGRSSKPQASSYSSRPEPFVPKMHSLDTIVDEDGGTDDKVKASPLRSGRSVSESDGGASSSKTDGGQSLLQQQTQQELAAEEIVYRDIMANLVTLAEVKNNVKKELKDWETEFQKKNGREPTADDKAAINDRYLAYKMVTQQVQDAKDQAKASEDKLKEIKTKLGLPV